MNFQGETKVSASRKTFYLGKMKQILCNQMEGWPDWLSISFLSVVTCQVRVRYRVNQLQLAVAVYQSSHNSQESNVYMATDSPIRSQ